MIELSQARIKSKKVKEWKGKRVGIWGYIEGYMGYYLMVIQWLLNGYSMGFNRIGFGVLML